jgi:predicted acylesterase/phospholipase RssA
MSYDSIILSGGSIKGFCTLGALQYMQDNKIIDDTLTTFAGTSIGTIISFLLIIGYTPIEIVVYLCSNNVLETFKPNHITEIFTGEGFYNYSFIYEHCEKLTLAKIDYIPTLKQLKDKFNKHMIICTYNLTQKKKEYIDYTNYPDLSCLDATRMSSNLPFLFNDFIYNGDEYVDGGLIENLPLSLMESKLKDTKMIAINLQDECMNNQDDDKISKTINKIFTIISIPIIGDTTIRKKYEKSIINIKVENLKVYTFKLSHSRKLELFSQGYNTAKKFFEDIDKCI